MRTYRGKTKEGRWVYGWYVKCRGHHYILPIHNDRIGFDERWIQEGANDEDGWFEVIPETVGQSTGRKDESREKIYTGDKIEFIPVDGSTKVRQIAEVYYDEKRTAFCVKSIVWNCPLSFCKEVEIIHENPELSK